MSSMAIAEASGSITESSKILKILELVQTPLNGPLEGALRDVFGGVLFAARDRVCGVLFGHRSCAIEPEKLTSFETPKLPCRDGRFCRATRSNGKVAPSFYIAKPNYYSPTRKFDA